MALQEHFGHTCGTAEITVDLERRMHIPEVVRCTVLQQVSVEHIAVIAVVQTRPLVEFPTHAPAGSTVTAVFEYHA